MKKFFTLFAVFAALMLVASCGGSSKNDDKTDTGDTVNDEDAADTDQTDTEPAEDNEPGGDTTSDETDSDDSDTTPAPKPDDDADAASEQNDDDVDTETDPTEGMTDRQKECYHMGGTYAEDGGTISCIITCESLPENAEWADKSEYSMNFVEDSGDGEEPFWLSECGKDGSGCITEYCGMPPKAKAAVEFHPCCFLCEDGFKWNGTKCETSKPSLPVCSATSTTPCVDPATNYVWSAETEETMAWEAAKEHCENLEEGGFKDWHLPTISELRTLVQGCDATMTGGTCTVTDDCQSGSCISGCSCDGTDSGYSKFGNTTWEWSLTKLANNEVFFVIGFQYGVVTPSSGSMHARCVRNTGLTKEKYCAAFEKSWNAEKEKCETAYGSPEEQECVEEAGGIFTEYGCYRNLACDPKPDDENTVWAHGGTYSEKYDYETHEWTCSVEHETEYGVGHSCNFVCSEEGYVWNGTACAEPAAPTPCDGNPCESVANSTGICAVSGETYTCGCNEGYGWNTGSMTCKQYCGAVFNGLDSSAKFAYNADKTPLLYPSQWTIEAWINQTAIPDSGTAPLITMQNALGDIPYMLSGISALSSQRIILGGVKQGDDSASVMAKVSAEYLNSWHHVALVYTGSALTIFVDGVVKGSKTGIGSIAALSNTVLWIGRATSTSSSGTGHGVTTTDYFKGTIDWLRFSKIARYSEGGFTLPDTNTVADSNTVALWDFNGNTNDSSTNALNLTGTNITYTTECK